MLPAGTRLTARALAWVFVMSGPIAGTAWGMADHVPAIAFGWYGLFLIPVHPIRPHPATACVTAVGLLLWFFAGFFAVLVAWYA
jgi:hypothetical protein